MYTSRHAPPLDPRPQTPPALNYQDACPSSSSSMPSMFPESRPAASLPSSPFHQSQKRNRSPVEPCAESTEDVTHKVHVIDAPSAPFGVKITGGPYGRGEEKELDSSVTPRARRFWPDAPRTPQHRMGWLSKPELKLRGGSFNPQEQCGFDAGRGRHCRMGPSGAIMTDPSTSMQLVKKERSPEYGSLEEFPRRYVLGGGRPEFHFSAAQRGGCGGERGALSAVHDTPVCCRLQRYMGEKMRLEQAVPEEPMGDACNSCLHTSSSQCSVMELQAMVEQERDARLKGYEGSKAAMDGLWARQVQFEADMRQLINTFLAPVPRPRQDLFGPGFLVTRMKEVKGRLYDLEHAVSDLRNRFEAESQQCSNSGADADLRLAHARVNMGASVATEGEHK